MHSKPSLPADVLWGLFVTHSFLPQMNAWQTNQKDVCGYNKPRLPDMPRDAAEQLRVLDNPIEGIPAVDLRKDNQRNKWHGPFANNSTKQKAL